MEDTSLDNDSVLSSTCFTEELEMDAFSPLPPSRCCDKNLVLVAAAAAAAVAAAAAAATVSRSPPSPQAGPVGDFPAPLPETLPPPAKKVGVLRLGGGIGRR